MRLGEAVKKGASFNPVGATNDIGWKLRVGENNQGGMKFTVGLDKEPSVTVSGTGGRTHGTHGTHGVSHRVCNKEYWTVALREPTNLRFRP
jgi:hypothetical protein